MSLMDIARRDCQMIMNTSSGFSSKITLIEPSNARHEINGIVNVINSVFDPDVGGMVQGLSATVSINRLDLSAQGVRIPEGEKEQHSKAWLIEHLDIDGNVAQYRVRSVEPDVTLGNILIGLENHESH